jgi:hypothetical protein
MAATNAQQSALAEALGFKMQVRASIVKKAIAILEAQGSYTAPQIARAKSILNGQALDSYYLAMAGSTNIVASTVTYDFVNRTTVSDIAEAALDSQVYAVVFTDLA